MTGNKLLLDTNIVIDFFNGKKDIVDKVNALPECYISSVVLGELFIGINRVTNKSKHLKKQIPGQYTPGKTQPDAPGFFSAFRWHSIPGKRKGGIYWRNDKYRNRFGKFSCNFS